MTRALVLLLSLVLAWPAAAEPPASSTAPVSSTSPRRYRIGDTDRPHAGGGWLQRIEDTLPVALLVFLGLRAGHVEVRGQVGATSVDVGGGSGGHR